jgi:hypothetical protein
VSRVPEPDPGFLTDVRSAFRVLVDRPLLPLLSLALSALILIPQSLTFLALPFTFFAIGFPGTQRLWLLRGLRGDSFTFSQAFNRNWSYFGRFFRLSFALFLPVGVGAGVGWLLSRSFLGLLLGGLAVGILLDFALTFVTPALAFSTRKVREAIPLGLRMIRSEWPNAALYVLVPPLAILLVSYLAPGAASIRRIKENWDLIKAGRQPQPIDESIRLISAGLSALSAMLGLLAKGATTAFYTRRFDVPAFGASSGPEDTPAAPPRPDV